MKGRNSLLATLGVLTAILTISCGDHFAPQVRVGDPGTASSPSTDPAFPLDSFDHLFYKPLPAAEKKSSIDDAQQDAPFMILRPALGDPLSVWQEKFVREGGAVALVYDTSAYGRLVVIESMTEQDRAAFDHYIALWVDSTGEPGTTGSSEYVTVRGQRARAGVSETGLVGLQFFENGFETSIFGPALTKDQTVKIADGMK